MTAHDYNVSDFIVNDVEIDNAFLIQISISAILCDLISFLILHFAYHQHQDSYLRKQGPSSSLRCIHKISLPCILHTIQLLPSGSNVYKEIKIQPVEEDN